MKKQNVYVTKLKKKPIIGYCLCSNHDCHTHHIPSRARGAPFSGRAWTCDTCTHSVSGKTVPGLMIKTTRTGDTDEEKKRYSFETTVRQQHRCRVEGTTTLPACLGGGHGFKDERMRCVCVCVWFSSRIQMPLENDYVDYTGVFSEMPTAVDVSKVCRIRRRFYVVDEFPCPWIIDFSIQILRTILEIIKFKPNFTRVPVLWCSWIV